jgi:oligoendopeptidase F
MAEKLPQWNLSDLYKSISDPSIEIDLTLYKRKAKNFARKYRGKITTSRDKRAQRVLSALKEYESILQGAVKPVIFASLHFSTDSTDPKRGAFLQKAKTGYQSIVEYLLFFELELLSLPRGEIKKLISDKRLAFFSHYLYKLLVSQPHRLSEAEEKVLSKKSLTGRSAFLRLFSEEFAAKRFVFNNVKGVENLTETQTLTRLYDGKRAVRKEAARALSNGLKEEARRLTYIFNTLVQDKMVDDELMQFSTPEQSRHLANEIEQRMVDAMTEAVTSRYSIVKHFYVFKKKLLKVDKIYDFDRYAPLGKSAQAYSYKQAIDLILESASRFSQEYAKIVREFVDNGWIDARLAPGKRGGAYCSFATPDLHPYVFTNYTGNLRDVFTLAHELGHAVHAWLMRRQGYLQFDVPLTIAETASVFGEMLLFEVVAEEIKDKRELLALYVGKIESIFATVFRQVSMYRFEQDVHALYRSKGELEVADFNSAWRKRQTEMFGNSVKLTKDYDYWWSYIPHFLHTPFYVYAYAFGELLTMSLYARYKKAPSLFAPKYIEFLARGGSASPKELLKPFGIDMTKPQFWGEGLSLIEDMVKRTYNLAGR